jgi:hypothetical protein
VLIAHNQLGHDPVRTKDAQGHEVERCPLYPGMTCQDHVDAMVDIGDTRDDALVPIPFIQLCPNSWLVPPTGKPVRIPEEDQFVAAKVRKRVEALQKTLGPAVPARAAGAVGAILARADEALEADRWGDALHALAGVSEQVPEPPKGIRWLVQRRMADLDERVGWAFEDLRDGKGPRAKRVAAVKALLASVDVSVLGHELPALARLRAWLK